MRTILSKFTLGKTLVTLFIASLMFWASTWQWERYKQKQVLVATFKTNTSREARSVPFDRLSASDPSTNRFEFRPSVEESEIISALRFHKVQLRGRYDYSKQVIVTNRRDPSGPGHHLMTPLLLEGENRAILVKRGFIPYEDRTAESFSKYDFPQEDSVKYAVFQEAVTPFLIGPQNPEIRTGAEFEHLWFYEEVAKMAKQLPYPVIQGAYVELLGGPPGNEGLPMRRFPAEAVSIRVPPSTHFGYSIEWALLGMLTLVIGTLVQINPWKRRPEDVNPKPAEMVPDMVIDTERPH